MSEPVNHAEVTKKALDTGGHAHRCGVEWGYACDCGAGPKIEAGYAALAAMQKELEEAKAYVEKARWNWEVSQGAQRALEIACSERDATITAQAERIARLEEALGAILGREHYLYCVCGRTMNRIPKGVREQAAAIVAASPLHNTPPTP